MVIIIVLKTKKTIPKDPDRNSSARTKEKEKENVTLLLFVPAEKSTGSNGEEERALRDIHIALFY